LADRLKGIKIPRPNEAHILTVYEGVIKYLLEEGK